MVRWYLKFQLVGKNVKRRSLFVFTLINFYGTIRKFFMLGLELEEAKHQIKAKCYSRGSLEAATSCEYQTVLVYVWAWSRKRQNHRQSQWNMQYFQPLGSYLACDWQSAVQFYVEMYIYFWTQMEQSIAKRTQTQPTREHTTRQLPIHIPNHRRLVASSNFLPSLAEKS